MDFVGKRRWYFLISALILVPGIVSLMIPPSVKAGIDFSSGSAVEIKFEQTVSEEDVRKVLAAEGHSNARIQRLASDTVFVRTKELEAGELSAILAELAASVGVVEGVPQVDTVDVPLELAARRH